MEEELKGIFDMGIVYPKEDKIISFLKKIYSIPFGESKRWEKELIKFFVENPFLFYFIERTIVEDNSFEQEVSSYLQTGKLCVHIDTNEVFKQICLLKEAVTLDRKAIKRFLPTFYILSRMYRQLFGKVLDHEDSTFQKFKSKGETSHWELKSSENNIKSYENVTLVCSDSILPIDFDKETQKVRKDFDIKLRRMMPKEIRKSKRNPIESRLRHECFKRDGYKCKECGKGKDQTTLHCDHILPVAQGGSDELDNLQTLCAECNLAKSDKKWESK